MPRAECLYCLRECCCSGWSLGKQPHPHQFGVWTPNDMHFLFFPKHALPTRVIWSEPVHVSNTHNHAPIRNGKTVEARAITVDVNSDIAQCDPDVTSCPRWKRYGEGLIDPVECAQGAPALKPGEAGTLLMKKNEDLFCFCLSSLLPPFPTSFSL